MFSEQWKQRRNINLHIKKRTFGLKTSGFISKINKYIKTNLDYKYIVLLISYNKK